MDPRDARDDVRPVVESERGGGQQQQEREM